MVRPRPTVDVSRRSTRCAPGPAPNTGQRPGLATGREPCRPTSEVPPDARSEEGPIQAKAARARPGTSTSRLVRTRPTSPAPMIAHIVLFNPKAGISEEQLRAFDQSVVATCQAVPSVSRATIGKAVRIDPGYQRSMGDKTYRFAAVLEFLDPAGLIAYLTHPSHDVLGRAFWDVCESTTVVEVDWRPPGDWTVDELVS